MSKSHYLWCKSLHSLPKFTSRTQRIQVGNGQFVSALFIIPIVIDIHGHWFKVFTLVSEIHKHVDLVFGIKNISELEGIMNSWESCFGFLNRSIPFFPKEKKCLETHRTETDKNRSTFHRWDLRVSNSKMLDKKTQNAMMLKLKFVWNSAMLDCCVI